jgi:hypothetical protein
MIPSGFIEPGRGNTSDVPSLLHALQTVESLLYRGIELVEPQDRDDDGTVADALASDDVISKWPEVAAP